MSFCLNTFVLCLVVSIAVPGFAQSWASTKPYFIEMPMPMTLDNHSFSPVLISGNGEAVFGYDGPGLAMWSKSSGITPVMKIGDAYNLFPKATNFDGNEVVGFFTVGDTVLDDYGLFDWSVRSGVQIIKPHFIPPPIGGEITSIHVSDGGHHISFMCTNPQTFKPKCLSDATLNDNPFVEKVWGPESGFQSQAWVLRDHYDYVRSSSDLNTHFVGVLGTANFGRLDNNGRYTQFEHFPMNFNPETYKVIMNRNATFVVVEEPEKHEFFAWNRLGNLISPLKIPAGCEGFRVSNIDDEGAFFGTAYCPKISFPSSDDIGLRVTLTGAQTIHEWLQLAGLRNDLGPVTVIQLVSDNGKTVYGTTALRAGVGNEGSAQTIDSANTNCLLNCSFLAHIQ